MEQGHQAKRKGMAECKGAKAVIKLLLIFFFFDLNYYKMALILFKMGLIFYVGTLDDCLTCVMVGLPLQRRRRIQFFYFFLIIDVSLLK